MSYQITAPHSMITNHYQSPLFSDYFLSISLEKYSSKLLQCKYCCIVAPLKLGRYPSVRTELMDASFFSVQPTKQLAVSLNISYLAFFPKRFVRVQMVQLYSSNDMATAGRIIVLSINPYTLISS